MTGWKPDAAEDEAKPEISFASEGMITQEPEAGPRGVE